MAGKSKKIAMGAAGGVQAGWGDFFRIFFSVFRGYLARDSEGNHEITRKVAKGHEKLGRGAVDGIWGAVGSRGKAKKRRDGRQEKRTMVTTEGHEI